MNVRTFGRLLKVTFGEWRQHNAPRLGAALAYFTVFSLAPLLIITIAVAGLAFGQEAARGQVVEQFQSLLGVESAGLIETMIASACNPAASIPAAIIGIVTLLLGALGVFGQLQDALNTIWEVAPQPGRGWRGLLRGRLVSFALVLTVGFLLLASLAVSAGLAALGEYFGGLLPSSEWTLELMNSLISLAVITLLLASIFKVLPDVSLYWRDVWPGAALTALLFTPGKFLIGLYLGRSASGSAYGAAGALIVLLVWIYYSAQILLFGAEFTRVYTRAMKELPEKRT